MIESWGAAGTWRVGETDRMGRLKHAWLAAALMLALLCANGWVMSADDGPNGPVGAHDTHEAVIATQLAMDEAEERKFWPIFAEYRYELAKLDYRRRQLLDDFREHATTLSVAQAQEWVDGWLDNQRGRVKLTDRFVKRFRRVLPEAKVARLVMLESARAAAEDARSVAWMPPLEGEIVGAEEGEAP